MLVVTPKPAYVDEHLKPDTMPYHEEWQLVHLFYIPKGVAVIPCGGTTYTMKRELNTVLVFLSPDFSSYYYLRFKKG